MPFRSILNIFKSVGRRSVGQLVHTRLRFNVDTCLNGFVRTVVLQLDENNASTNGPIRTLHLGSNASISLLDLVSSLGFEALHLHRYPWQRCHMETTNFWGRYFSLHFSYVQSPKLDFRYTYSSRTLEKSIHHLCE